MAFHGPVQVRFSNIAINSLFLLQKVAISPQPPEPLGFFWTSSPDHGRDDSISPAHHQQQRAKSRHHRFLAEAPFSKKNNALGPNRQNKTIGSIQEHLKVNSEKRLGGSGFGLGISRGNSEGKRRALKKLDHTLARKNDAPMPNRKMHLTIYHVKVFSWSLCGNGNVSLYVFVFVYSCLCFCVCVFVCLFVFFSEFVFVCLRLCVIMFVCLCFCVFVFLWVCVCVCVFVWFCLCFCVCVCVLCVCVSVFVCLFVLLWVCFCVFVWFCLCFCVCVSVFLWFRVFLFSCLCVCVCVLCVWTFSKEVKPVPWFRFLDLCGIYTWMVYLPIWPTWSSSFKFYTGL